MLTEKQLNTRAATQLKPTAPTPTIRPQVSQHLRPNISHLYVR